MVDSLHVAIEVRSIAKGARADVTLELRRLADAVRRRQVLLQPESRRHSLSAHVTRVRAAAVVPCAVVVHRFVVSVDR